MFIIVENRYGLSGVAVHLHGVYLENVQATKEMDAMIKKRVGNCAVEHLCGDFNSDTWRCVVVPSVSVSYYRIAPTEGLVASIDMPWLSSQTENILKEVEATHGL